MSLDDLDNWEPEPTKPDIQSMLSHVSPYRVDKKAEERRAMCVEAKSRRFECPGCGIARHVEPVYSGEEWHYFGQCSHCGARWVNAYHLMRRCDDCGKKVPITSRNPEGRCNCQGETPRPF